MGLRLAVCCTLWTLPSLHNQISHSSVDGFACLRSCLTPVILLCVLTPKPARWSLHWKLTKFEVPNFPVFNNNSDNVMFVVGYWNVV